MNKINLHDEFIKALYEKVPDKRLLVEKISDILRIEKEPASRRLNGKVLFSVQEMGILAQEMHIVIDSLLDQEKRFQWIPFLLESPMSVGSMDDLALFMEDKLDHISKVAQKKTSFGTIFHVLPMELYGYYPYLMKFMLFKWGYYFVSAEEYSDFSQWEIPNNLMRIIKEINEINRNVEHALYIWDESLIWTLVSEINYLHKLQVLNTEDRNHIKDDLKKMLSQLEKYLRTNSQSTELGGKISFYVSNINVGITSVYYFSEDRYMSSIRSSFSFSHVDDSYESYNNIKAWVDSFKRISVLISGSGSLERRLFFKKQHRIIDLFLGEMSSSMNN